MFQLENQGLTNTHKLQHTYNQTALKEKTQTMTFLPYYFPAQEKESPSTRGTVNVKYALQQQ